MSNLPIVLMLGIGNLLWASEGFGIRALESLQRHYHFSDIVRLLDGGTQGIYPVQPIREVEIEALAMAEMLGDYPQHLLLVDLQPVELEDYGGSLRNPVTAQIEPAIAIVLAYRPAPLDQDVIRVDVDARLEKVKRESEHQLHVCYPCDNWPALVMLHEGVYVGAISRMQDWDIYLTEIERLLNTQPATTPGFRIPVVSAAGQCH